MMLLFLISLVFSSNTPMIIPQPAEMKVLDGSWILSPTDSIYYDSSVDGAQEVAQFCAEQLRTVTGYSLPLVTGKDVPKTGILFLKSQTDTKDEEYDVSATTECFKILATKRSGLFYGYQTLLQLLPIKVFANTTQTGITWECPCVSIHDYPNYQWRGILVDVARHFFDIPTIKTIIDGMCISKLNTIHMHLTDDQAWRIEIKRYPRLVEIGSIRDESPIMWDRDHLDGTPYGPYSFTQDELRDLISYAKKRGITIVPEIEMPGHGLSALAGYPQYSCTGGPFKPRCEWGVQDNVYCAGNDETFEFLQNILDEVLDLFNESVFIHCGGDECPKTKWSKCPKCQKRIKDEGLKNENELQSWFVQKMANYVKSKDHRLIGWDEILEGGLADGAAVMSWQGVSGGQAAARMGHDVVMTPAYYLYLDYNQFPIKEKYEYNALLSTTPRIYNYDPRAGISQEYKKYIIGVQGNAWAEFIWHRDDLQYKIFPRSCSVGETGWTPDNQKSWSRFARNLHLAQIERLKLLGLNVAPLANQPEAVWESGDIKDKWVSVTWDVSGTIEQSGTYGVLFMYTHGANGINVRNVKLLINSAVVGTDSHEGNASENPSNNQYTFYVGEQSAGVKIEITAEVMSDSDGDDSNGNVFIYCL